jgi:hypothetical protein
MMDNVQKQINCISICNRCSVSMNLSPFHTLNFRGYLTQRYDHFVGDRAKGRIAILVKNCVCSASLNLYTYTPLHATSIRVSYLISHILYMICICHQSSWLQIQRYRVRFPALPGFLRSSGSGTRSTQPREDN